MKKIGIISDTHGTFDGTLREFLKDVDEIWHAGDIGSLELADAIAAFKPLRAVSGNIDGGLTRRVYPDFLSFECEGVRVLMTHIGGYPRRYDPRAVAKIQSLRPKLFIAGHSHILKVAYDPVYDLLHAEGVMTMTSITGSSDKVKNPYDRRVAYLRELVAEPDIIETDYPSEFIGLPWSRDAIHALQEAAMRSHRTNLK